MRSLGGFGSALGFALVMFAATPAMADDTQSSDTQPSDTARADALFTEAVALIDHDLARGCAKFAESLRYNKEAIGTLLNVARCDEKAGRVASAAAKYREVRARAREHNSTEYLSAADDQLKLLEPHIPRLGIKLAEPAVAATRVLVDDALIPFDTIANIEVDPGERSVVVTAPGRVAFQATIVIAPRETKELVVPALAFAIVKSSWRRVGQIATVFGGTSAAVGVVIGLVARSRYQAQFKPDAMGVTHCDSTTNQCDDAGLGETRRARTIGIAGSVAGIGGLVVLGVGAYLWLRSPHETQERAVSVVPELGRDSAGIAAVGRF